MEGIQEIREDIFTKDGTTAFNKKPANKRLTGTWKACAFILCYEFCERLAFYGISTNLVNYLQSRFNQGNATAAKSVSNWTRTCYITPLLGAFLADSYLGKFWIIALFSVIYLVGMSLLSFSSFIHTLKPSCNAKGDCNPTGFQTTICFVALYVIALGSGAIKPCVSSFGADQFDDTDEVEKEKKDSYFNMFYFSINFSGLIASSLLVYVQVNDGWGLGFGIPAIALAIALVIFLSGTPYYRLQKPGGSALTRIFQVIIASIRNRNATVPADTSLLYETVQGESTIEGSRKLNHTEGLSFFDKAAVKTQPEIIQAQVSQWKLCTVTQVEELKSIVRLLPIWASGIVFAAVYAQMSTMFVLQGNTMDPQLGPDFKIPSASLFIFDTLSVLIWVPIYNYLIIPMARKFKKNGNGFTHLQRMGIGLFLSIFTMVVAGIVEVRRLKMIRTHHYENLKCLPMSIFWQVPQYLLIGCAEVFTFKGQMEFFYDQAPDAMRSLCSALSLTTVALGNFLSSQLVTIVTKVSTRNGGEGWIPPNLNRGHLDYFYWLLAILSIANFAVYLVTSRLYTCKAIGDAPGTGRQIEVNQIDRSST